jgi:hypothetical protein
LSVGYSSIKINSIIDLFLELIFCSFMQREETEVQFGEGRFAERFIPEDLGIRNFAVRYVHYYFGRCQIPRSPTGHTVLACHDHWHSHRCRSDVPSPLLIRRFEEINSQTGIESYSTWTTIDHYSAIDQHHHVRNLHVRSAES